MEVLAGLQSVREALRARRRRFGVLWIRAPGPGAGATPGSPRGADELVALAEAAGVSVEWAPSSELEAGLPPGVRSQGVLLEAGPLPELGLPDVLRHPPEEAPVLVALDEVEDPQNAGAVARAAEAAGAAALLLTRRRAPPLSPAVSRASAGAIEHLPVARVPNLARALRELHARGYWRLGADAAPDATPVEATPDALWTGAVVLVLGSEERGLRPGVAKELDQRVRIPMRGQVASLNVGAAAAVLLFELARRRARARPAPPSDSPRG
jgi:23S rRNA (guanosine2251-2'-O)-methyltransferase